eukprot:1539505-Amphidinium_carterae.2
MRTAAEGSGDNKGLSEKLDEEEKEKIMDAIKDAMWHTLVRSQSCSHADSFLQPFPPCLLYMMVSPGWIQTLRLMLKRSRTLVTSLVLWGSEVSVGLISARPQLMAELVARAGSLVARYDPPPMSLTKLQGMTGFPVHHLTHMAMVPSITC